jgi:hypothetical protein
MESRANNDEGVRFYNSYLDWTRGLKKLGKSVNDGPSDEYKKICIEMNKRFMESGLIKDPPDKKGACTNKPYAQLFAETEKLKASCKKLKKALKKNANKRNKKRKYADSSDSDSSYSDSE